MIKIIAPACDFLKYFTLEPARCFFSIKLYVANFSAIQAIISVTTIQL
jgi:hypothetical protein